MIFYQLGQCAALEKLGYDLADAHRVLQAAKKYVLPKASNRLVPKPQSILGSGAVSSPISARAYGGFNQQVTGYNKLQKTIEQNVPSAIEPVRPRRTGDVPLLATSKRLTDNWKQPLAIIPGASDHKHVVSNLVGDPSISKIKFNPEQHKMMQSVIRGHELDEGLVDLKQSMRDHGHNSPDVLLREHNRLVTMPAGFEPVQDVFKKFRSGPDKEADLLRRFGVNYGEGERINRHQRKHITRAMEHSLMVKEEAKHKRTRAFAAQIEAAMAKQK